MSVLTSLFRLLSQAFQQSDTSDRKRIRETIERDSDEPVMEISIWQSDALTERRGRMPEKMVAKCLAYAFEDAGFDYEINYGYEQTFDPPTEQKDSFDWWVKNSPEKATTSNILLVNNRGGGRAGLTGHNAIVGMGRVNDVHDVNYDTCDTQACDNAWAAIHEVGHNLGGRHATPMMEPKPKIIFSDEMKSLLNERLKSSELDVRYRN